MNLRVLELRYPKKESPLKAFVDIQLDGMEIRNFRIIQENGQKPYLVCPQMSWRDKGGQINFKTLITFPNDLKWQVEAAVLSEFQRVREEKRERDST